MCGIVGYIGESDATNVNGERNPCVGPVAAWQIVAKTLNENNWWNGSSAALNTARCELCRPKKS